MQRRNGLSTGRSGALKLSARKINHDFAFYDVENYKMFILPIRFIILGPEYQFFNNVCSAGFIKFSPVRPLHGTKFTSLSYENNTDNKDEILCEHFTGLFSPIHFTNLKSNLFQKFPQFCIDIIIAFFGPPNLDIAIINTISWKLCVLSLHTGSLYRSVTSDNVPCPVYSQPREVGLHQESELKWRVPSSGLQHQNPLQTHQLKQPRPE